MFKDDGTCSNPVVRRSLQATLRLPQLVILTVETPSPGLFSVLGVSNTKLTHVNFYDTKRQHVPLLVRFIERRRCHNLTSFLLSFGSIDHDMAFKMCTWAVDSVEIMNESTRALSTSAAADVLICTVAHFLRCVPLGSVYVTTQDDDLRFGRCDMMHHQPRHHQARAGMRPRCSAFIDGTPDMLDMDVQRPVCRVTLFNIPALNIRHTNNFTKLIHPHLSYPGLYCLLHNPCATFRLRNPAQLANNPQMSRNGVISNQVRSTALRRLVMAYCDCELWRFDWLPALHALEITPSCVEALQHAEDRALALRTVRQSSCSLRRVHVETHCGENAVNLIQDVLRNAPKVTMLDLSISFVVTTVNDRTLLPVLSNACDVRVIYIGCLTLPQHFLVSTDSRKITIPSLVAVLPRFLRYVTRCCDKIARIDLHGGSLVLGKDDPHQFVRMLRWSLKALDAFNSTLAYVDTSSIREQFQAWGREAELRLSATEHQ